MRHKHGFTLLEVIIVIIIIGVLASLALPRFFSTVEYSRATEAMQAIATIRQSMERCYLMTRTYGGSCLSFATLDVENPANSPNSHFTYALSNGAVTGYTIKATRNAVDGGSTANSVSLTYASGTITRSGTGAFGAVQ